jgi:hypothetical protein
MKKLLLIIALSLLPQFAHADITTGLVGWWKLDEGTSSTTADSSGIGGSGTLVSNTTWTAASMVGPFAVDLNGTSNWVSINDYNEADPEGAITISAWIKATSADTAQMNIMGKMRSTSGFSGWTMYRSAGEKFEFTIRNTSSATSTGASTAVSDGTYANTDWHHVVGVYNGAQVRIYVDGVNGDSTPPSTTIFLQNTANFVCLGSVNAGSPGCSAAIMWGGTIDDARIYNRALSADDVAELYLYTDSPAVATFSPKAIIRGAVRILNRMFIR